MNGAERRRFFIDSTRPNRRVPLLIPFSVAPGRIYTKIHPSLYGRG